MTTRHSAAVTVLLAAAVVPVANADIINVPGDQPTIQAGMAALNVPYKTAEMLRTDLERAGLPYIDDAGEVFDFHSLRVQCATNLARGGAHPTVAQARMRHSTIKLTMDLYTRVNPGERSAAALEALPNLSTG